MPKGYQDLSDGLKKEICNGCGSRSFGGIFIPNKMYGMDMKECCNIHDYMYHVGKDIQDKDSADRAFLNNMMRKIEGGSKLLRWVRRERAAKYYYAVKLFGGGAFWDGKNA